MGQVFRKEDLHGVNVEVDRQFPALPAPIGDKHPYHAYLTPDCPRGVIHVRGIPFYKARYKPLESDKPAERIPNLILLADNQLEPLKELVRAKRVQVTVEFEENGETTTTKASVPVSNWARIAVHVEPPKPLDWEGDDGQFVQPPENAPQPTEARIVPDPEPAPVAEETVTETPAPATTERVACPVKGCRYQARGKDPQKLLEKHMANKHGDA